MICLNAKEILDSGIEFFWEIGFDHRTDESHVLYVDYEKVATKEAACRLIREKLKVEVTSCRFIRCEADRVIEPMARQ